MVEIENSQEPLCVPMHFFPSTTFDSTSHPEGTRMSTPIMAAMAATLVVLELLLRGKRKKRIRHLRTIATIRKDERTRRVNGVTVGGLFQALVVAGFKAAPAACKEGCRRRNHPRNEMTYPWHAYTRYPGYNMSLDSNCCIHICTISRYSTRRLIFRMVSRRCLSPICCKTVPG